VSYTHLVDIMNESYPEFKIIFIPLLLTMNNDRRAIFIIALDYVYIYMHSPWLCIYLHTNRYCVCMCCN